jgi:hypothetical protein
MLVLALGCGGLTAAAAEPKSPTTSFTVSPAPGLPPNPRRAVDVAPLADPTPPAPPASVALPLAAAQLYGRWTERDPAYCDREQYVLEWTPDRLRVLVDGRAIEARAVRYASETGSLKMERLTDAGEVAGYWRLVAVDDDHVKWSENAERRGDGTVEVIARPDRLLVRCPADAAPAPGWFGRAKLLFTSLIDRVSPWSKTPSGPAAEPMAVPPAVPEAAPPPRPAS